VPGLTTDNSWRCRGGIGASHHGFGAGDQWRVAAMKDDEGLAIGVVSSPSARHGEPVDTSQRRRHSFDLSLQRRLHGQAERLSVDEAEEHGTVVPHGGVATES
jgi:hypothetical protein